MANKISTDGAHVVKTQLKSSIESIADTVEKLEPGHKILNAIQPQLEHIFTILFDIENNWEKTDK